MTRNIKSLLSLVFPATCLCCMHKSNLPFDLCAYCYHQLPWVKERCYQCATPLTKEYLHILCEKCHESPPPFDAVKVLFEHTFPIDKMISKFKFGHMSLYANLFGTLMADQVLHHWYQDKAKPTKIVPMPLSDRRYVKRGFNQAFEIAKVVSRKTNIPIARHVATRIKPTLSQATLSKRKRAHNVKSAFLVEPNTLEHIAVIDDIFTTGHTVRALSVALQETGIQHIDIWCVCRG